MGEIKPIEIKLSCPWCQGVFWVDANHLPIGLDTRLWCPYCGKKIGTMVRWKEKPVPELQYVTRGEPP